MHFSMHTMEEDQEKTHKGIFFPDVVLWSQVGSSVNISQRNKKSYILWTLHFAK